MVRLEKPLKCLVKCCHVLFLWVLAVKKPGVFRRQDYAVVGNLGHALPIGEVCEVRGHANVTLPPFFFEPFQARENSRGCGVVWPQFTAFARCWE
jgi:hypothetical protein